jgi:phage N-6-adenine-methyltransferase
MSEHRHYEVSDAGPEWGTPEYIVEPLAQTLGGFDLDSAAGAEPKPYADERFTGPPDGRDGLQEDWHGAVWLNPPYSREHNPKWAQKVTEEYHGNPDIDHITALVPASTSTDWWQNHYALADYHTFIDHRVNFVGDGENSASFASVLCTFDPGPPGQYFMALADLGQTFTRYV